MSLTGACSQAEVLAQMAAYDAPISIEFRQYLERLGFKVDKSARSKMRRQATVGAEIPMAVPRGLVFKAHRQH